MSVFPEAYDDDSTLQRVEDNLTEVGGLAIDQLRGAVFAIQEALGLLPGGSVTSVANRLDVGINPNGTFKSSALASAGLVTLPITNNQIASNAGIEEYKLSLDYTTANLHTLITTNSALLNSLTAFTNTTFSDLNLHISGSPLLSDGSSSARHVLSQIDINSLPSDPRDLSFVWTGLRDKFGILRSATNAMSAILQINDDLTSHENALSNAHVASAITVDTDNFSEIPVEANSLQKVLDYLDDAETLNLGQHRATQHANAIAPISRSEDLFDDGYGGAGTVINGTPVFTYLIHPPNTTTVDDLSVGDDIIKFQPTDNSNYIFDAQFSQVKIGDIVTVFYNISGIKVSYPIESIRFTPGSEWIIRINGSNLFESQAIARIDRANYDTNTYGILACAAANAHDASGPAYTQILSSVTVGNPRGATALGLGFDAGQLNSTHYNLWLQIYPTGNPVDKVISLPPIDITGNLGTTSGLYTLESIVQSTNDQFRRFGFNYRFIAFAHSGEFGLMLADAINNVSFSIISGDNSSGTLTTGSYVNNIIGGNSIDLFDGLGFGVLGANIASPAYQNTWTDEIAAQLPTKIISPLKRRYYTVNGNKLDKFENTYLANADGYWDGYISSRNQIGISTVETTYTILKNLAPAGLKPGKTIVIQPTVSFSDSLYSDIDYGRFIIKSINFISCDLNNQHTQITVINSLHADGNPVGPSGDIGLDVRLYFSYDTVDFDDQNIIDTGISATDYSRFHEIFISDKGKTFSHERARMPRQSETSELLATSNWHIETVSPKLRGYLDGTASVFNKYVRFYVLNYDSNTGEFDGYLGKRIPSLPGIIKKGRTITGRKNVITRFYDETDLDYIDLIFKDDAPSPGTNVLSSSIGRYVDIEIFNSLQLDDELFYIASCDVNWSPGLNQNIVQYVKDRRQFGSVDETDLTDSAKEFISSGDRYLHENGVIRGLELDSVSSVLNSGEIFFKGGLALVNGSVVAVNNDSCTIPQIYPSGTVLPQTVDWIICINENGNLIPLVLTNTKQQFFATSNGINSYYLQSVTLLELSEIRKDLTPIYIANVTIASLTINSVTDARRFIYNQSLANSLVWSSDGKLAGNFKSFDALKIWINRSEGYSNKVEARGIFDLSSSIDLRGFTKKVILDGTNSIFNCNNNKGFLVGSNLQLENCTFNYTVSSKSYTSGNLINVGDGCLFGVSGTNIENFSVKNCIFNALNTTQRSPFISLEMSKGQVNKKIEISGNYFNDTPSNDLGEKQAAIVFWTYNNGVSTYPPLLNDVFVEKNTVSHHQGIYVTTVAGTTGAESPGLNTINVSINKNNCGNIGFVTSSFPTSLTTEFVNQDRNFGLQINGNTCDLIGSIYHTTLALDIDNINYGTGAVSIEGNFSHWISCLHKEDVSANQFSTLTIRGNHLSAFDPGYLISGMSNGAIVVSGSTAVESHALISENTIGFGRFNSITYGYDYGIRSFISANISGNIIKGLSTNAFGISASGDGSVLKRWLITGNQIFRYSNTITQYIRLDTFGVDGYGICSLNSFDSPYIDIGSTNTNTINTNYSGDWIVDRNRNQTITINLKPHEGQITLRTATSSERFLAGNLEVTNSFARGTDSIDFIYNDPGGATANNQFLEWAIPFNSLPQYSVLVDASAIFYVDTLPNTQRTASVIISNTSLGTSTTTASMTNIPTQLINNSHGYKILPQEAGYILYRVNVQDSASNRIAHLVGSLIRCRYL